MEMAWLAGTNHLSSPGSTTFQYVDNIFQLSTTINKQIMATTNRLEPMLHFI